MQVQSQEAVAQRIYGGQVVAVGRNYQHDGAADTLGLYSQLMGDVVVEDYTEDGVKDMDDLAASVVGGIQVADTEANMHLT